MRRARWREKFRFRDDWKARLVSNSISISNLISNLNCDFVDDDWKCSNLVFKFKWNVFTESTLQNVDGRALPVLIFKSSDVDGGFLTFTWAGLHVRMFLPIYSQQMSMDLAFIVWAWLCPELHVGEARLLGHGLGWSSGWHCSWHCHLEDLGCGVEAVEVDLRSWWLSGRIGSYSDCAMFNR